MLSAMQTAFKILAGFILVKVVALATGPEGVAQLGQFQNLVAVLAVLSGGMFYTGVTKLVAESAHDRARVLGVVRTSLLTSFISFCAIAITMGVTHDYIATQLLKNSLLGGFVVVLPLMVFLTTLYGLWLAVLNGFRRVRELVVTSIASSVLMIGLTFALALPFGEIGAYIAILAPPAVVLLFVFTRRFDSEVWLALRTSGTASAPPYRELARFALMGLVSAVAAPIAQMVMREYLAETLSLEQSGIWQGVTRISEVYLVFVTSTLSVYFLPKLAQAARKNDLVQLLKNVLKLAIPSALIFGILIYIFRDSLIWLLFTSEFNSMRELFFWQIAGDMVKIVSWVFAYVILVKGSALLFVFGEVVFNFTYPILGVLIVPRMGLEGAVVAYGINYIFYLIFVVLAVRGILKKSDALRK